MSGPTTILKFSDIPEDLRLLPQDALLARGPDGDIHMRSKWVRERAIAIRQMIADAGIRFCSAVKLDPFDYSNGFAPCRQRALPGGFCKRFHGGGSVIVPKIKSKRRKYDCHKLDIFWEYWGKDLHGVAIGSLSDVIESRPNITRIEKITHYRFHHAFDA